MKSKTLTPLAPHKWGGEEEWISRTAVRRYEERTSVLRYGRCNRPLPISRTSVLRYMLLCLVVIASETLAGGSIFSANGHGEQLQTGGIRAEGLAGGGLGLIDSLSFNSTNPAAIAFAKKTTLRIGGQIGAWTTTVDGRKDSDAETVWKDFRIFLPIANRWTFGFGVDPAQRMDVKLFERNVANFPDGSEQEFEERSSWLGSTVDIRLDNGYRVNNKLSLGLGVSYRFLHEDFTKTLDFDSSGFRDVGYAQTIEYRGWAFNLGAQYQLTPNFGVGAYFKPRSSGNWTHDYKKSDSDSVLDSEASGEAPGEIGAGVALKLRKGYMLVGDVKYGMWDERDVREVFGRYRRYNSPAPASPMWISVANERVLERALEAKSGISAWRVGAFYRKNYWPHGSPGTVNAEASDISSENIDFGLTLGSSVFVSSGSGLIHGALELGMRSQADPLGHDTNENFGRLSIQIEIAEKWFQKSKRRGLK